MELQLKTMIIAGCLIISAISGFVSFGTMDNTAGTIRKILLSAALLSIISIAMLFVGLYLKLNKLVVLISTAVLMFISFVMYVVAIVKMGSTDANGVKYRTANKKAHVAAIISMLTALCGLITVGVSAFYGGNTHPVVVAAPPATTTIRQEPPYTDVNGALKQLQQLQVGSGLNKNSVKTGLA